MPDKHITDKHTTDDRRDSPTDLLETIRNAGQQDLVIAAGIQTPLWVAERIRQGEPSLSIIRTTAEISDSILSKLITLALEELGPAPAPFSFLVFGSVGRREQTLKTDQDNALVYADAEGAKDPKIRDYFLTLGRKVCTWLNSAGYRFCEGGNMAMNPTYCQPLSVWKQYFSQWVGGGEALDLLKVQIFFDFRNIYGDPGIEEELRGHLEQGVAGNHRFFQILARNILQSTPPVGFFGQFVVETEGPGRGSFNIKNAMMPLVDFARIYAMKHAVRSVSTIQRLDDLLTQNILSSASHGDIVRTFADLMQIRLKVQAMAAGSAWSFPSNRIFPKSLDKGEQKHLKELFSRIRNFQARLSYDFTGQLGI